jgi:drug/metabolite transporter (DMT)-like permease
VGKKAEGEQSVATADTAFPAAARNAGQTDFTALAALAGAVLLWSGTFIAMKLVLEVFHPVFMIFARMCGSVLLLFPFLRAWSRKTPYAGGDWRIIALMVICEPCLYFMFEGYALRYTTASQAGLVTSLMPLMVGVGAFLFLGERLSLRAWLGFFLAVGGVALLSFTGESDESAPNALLGNGLELCAMLMGTVYTLCVRKLAGYPPFFICAMQAGAGALFFGLMIVVTGAPLPEALPPLTPLLALVFLCFSTVLAYGLYNTGVARLSAARAAAWINLIPALTLFMGITFLGESLTQVQALAVLPILGGVLLTQVRGRRRA